MHSLSNHHHSPCGRKGPIHCGIAALLSLLALVCGCDSTAEAEIAGVEAMILSASIPTSQAKAAQAAAELCERHPGQARAWLAAGQAMRMLETRGQAAPLASADCFGRAHEMEPSSQDAALGLAQALLEQGKPAEARAILLQAARANQHDSRILALLGQAALLEGRRALALQYLEQANAQASILSLSLARAASLYRELGLTERAKLRATQAAALLTSFNEGAQP